MSSGESPAARWTTSKSLAVRALISTATSAYASSTPAGSVASQTGTNQGRWATGTGSSSPASASSTIWRSSAGLEPKAAATVGRATPAASATSRRDVAV